VRGEASEVRGDAAAGPKPDAGEEARLVRAKRGAVRAQRAVRPASTPPSSLERQAAAPKGNSFLSPEDVDRALATARQMVAGRRG